MCVLKARAATATRITLNRVVITLTSLVPRLPPEFLLLGQSVSLMFLRIWNVFALLREHLPLGTGCPGERIAQNARRVLQRFHNRPIRAALLASRPKRVQLTLRVRLAAAGIAQIPAY